MAVSECILFYPIIGGSAPILMIDLKTRDKIVAFAQKIRNLCYQKKDIIMQSIVFATGNPNKVREVTAMLGDCLNIIGLQDIGCHEDIPETAPTLEGNALQKARYVKDNYQHDCFSEDTGLEVDALDGDPGVYTARYAGDQKDPNDNMDLLLKNLVGQENRKAQFRTVIALTLNGEEHTFEGVARGTIAMQKSGAKGFGYDPVFIPEGHTTTFAEMTQDAKAEISHRGQAVRKLIAFLQTL